MITSQAHTILISIACTVACPQSRADSWGAPRTQMAYSPSSNFVARVTPGDGHRIVGDFKPDMRTRCALVEFHAAGSLGHERLLWRTNSLNPVMPVTIEVSDQGHLVLMDNWHSVGYGKVFTLFAPDGRMVRGSTLEELLGTNRIVNTTRSVSSHWWHSGGRFGTGGESNLFILKLGVGQSSFRTTNAMDDGELLIQLQTGSLSRRFPVRSDTVRDNKSKP